MSLVFSYLSKVLFSGFPQFKGNFVDGQNNSNYCNVTTLNFGMNSKYAMHLVICLPELLRQLKESKVVI